MQNLCSGLNVLFRGTKVVKYPFYSNGPKMMFESVLEQFAILWHVNMQNLWSILNALFRGTKVEKHAFYSIGTETMFGSVSEHFANLRYAKDAKHVF
jgi:hypothetical protein